MPMIKERYRNECWRADMSIPWHQSIEIVSSTLFLYRYWYGIVPTENSIPDIDIGSFRFRKCARRTRQRSKFVQANQNTAVCVGLKKGSPRFVLRITSAHLVFPLLPRKTTRNEKFHLKNTALQKSRRHKLPGTRQNCNIYRFILIPGQYALPLKQRRKANHKAGDGGQRKKH